MTAPYAERITVREPTMSKALQLLEERGGMNIVETGCTRLPDNWGGDGMSTLVFGRWAKDHGGHLWTVDADPNNLAMCKVLTEDVADVIDYSHDDSVIFLAGHGQRIDLLYLDSFDYPLFDLLKMYGYTDDSSFTATVEKVKALGDDFLVREHYDVIGDCQRHCLKEIRSANINPGTIVLIDDANLPGGGKARLARLQLLEWGWRCVMDEYQTLWVYE